MNCCSGINIVIFLRAYIVMVNISSCGEQSVSCDDNSNVQHGICAKSGAEQPRFSFSGKPGINVDLEDPSNSMGDFGLCCRPEIAGVAARETNLYAQKFLENTPNLKGRSRTHHWRETYKNEIMNLLAFFVTRTSPETI
jgi:hypothetical protein